MAAEVGAAFISIRPNLAGFHKQITKDLRSLGPQLLKIGKSVGADFRKGFETGLGDPLSGPLDESTKKQRTKAPKQGEETAGAFAKGFSKRLKAAFAALPKAEINADSSAADKKIAEIRGQLEALSNKTVGVDIDAGAALAEVKAIQAELDSVGRDSKSIQVDVDTAAAMVELAAVRAEVDALDGRRVRVGVSADVAPALAAVKLMSISLLGLAAIPIGATLGAGILSLAGPLAAAGAGFAGLAAVAVPAFSDIANAQKAQAAAQQAATGTAAQAKAANDKLAASLKALSPAERSLLTSLNGLKTAFKDWSTSLQPAVLPIFTRGINLLKASLPALTPIVRGAAGAVRGLLDDVANAAKSPFWVQLRTNITNLVPTAVTGFGHILGNVATGLAGIVSAFLPYAPAVLGFITKITAGFARWGQGLGTSNGFATFINYVKANAPLIAKTVGQIAGAIGHVVQSLGPLASLAPLALGGLGLLAKILSGLKPGEIQAIAIGIGLIVAATKLWTIAQIALDIALNANPIGLIIVAIGALIAAVILAYNHVGWFHTAVVAAWNGIKTAALFVWNSVLKPVFNALTVAVQAVATAALWLWKNVLVPAFNAISLAARILFAIVAVAVLAPLVIAFNLLRDAVLFLWHYVIVPAFNAIKTVIMAAWAFVKPIFDMWWAGVKMLGSAALWLWHSAIVPAWHGVQAAISAVWNGVIHPVFNAINAVIRGVIAPVFRWIYSNVIKPVWSAAGSVIRSVWTGAIRPAFDALKTGLSAIRSAFSVAVSAIGKIWKGLEAATKKPVQFVVNTVYNNGIRSVWDKIAGLVHLPQLPTVKFATGGVFPGYTPGRDPYQMPMAAFSGGEAVMRPEFTRAVGSDFVYAANAVARRRGPGGVRDWLANADMKFARGGVMPGPVVQKFAGGGILGALSHAASLVVHGASSILDAGASAFARHALDPILSRVPGGDSTYARAIYSLPKRMIDGFVGWLKKAVDPKLGGDPLGVVAQAKKFVGVGDDRGPNNNMWTRAWGMPGAPWCAMFVSDMIKRAGAQKHYPGYPTAAVAGYNGRMRHVSTGDGRAGDLGVYGGGSHINIIAGKKGGAYDTYGGNQNAVVQHRVRGGQTSMLRPAYAYGGILGRQAQRIFRREAPHNADPHELQTPLVQLMRSLPAGQMGSVARAIVSKNLQVTNAGVYDNGGVVPPGLNLVANASRRPEALLNDAQWSALTSAAGSSGEVHNTTYNMTTREITLTQLQALQRQQETLARVGRPH